MSAADKLRQAKALIEDPARWCQGTSARGRTNRPCDPNSRRAWKWCAFGACDRIGAATGFLNRAAIEADFFTAARVNDETDHPTVMKMFDRAIELAEKAEEQT